MEAVETCQNCHKSFPESKIASHFSYCRRNIRRCDFCTEMIDINHLDEHMEDAHSKEQCQWCRKEFDSKVFDAHKKTCSSRPLVCAYCQQSVPSKTFDEHQQECGSRTKKCSKCPKDILMREYDVHQATCTGPIEVASPATVKAYTNYNDYIRKQREHLGLEKKEDLQPTRPTIERVRITVADQLAKKSGEESPTHKHQIKTLGTRVVRIGEPRPINKQDEGFVYEPRSTNVIRANSTVIKTYTVPAERVITRATVVEPSVAQHYGFEDEDAELQRALLESMGYN